MKYLRLNAAVAYAGFSLAFTTRYENIRGFTSSKPLYDEVGLLVTQQSGEDTLTMSPALLYALNTKTNVGMASLYSRALVSGGYSHLYGPVATHSLNSQLNGLLGIGLNSSPAVHSGWCGFFMVNFVIQPSLSVMDLSLRNQIAQEKAKKSLTPSTSESLSQ